MRATQILLILILSVGSLALAKTQCSNLFNLSLWIRFQSKAQTIGSEIIQTKGGAILFRRSIENQTKWGGLLEISDARNTGVLERVHYFVWKAPLNLTGLEKSGRYELSPLNLLTESLLNRPIRKLSRMTLKNEWEPNTLAQLSFGIGSAILIFNYLDEKQNEKIIKEKQQLFSETESTLWDLLNYDYRYSEIHSELVDGRLNKEEALVAAYGLSYLLAELYQKINDGQVDYPSLENHAFFKKYQIFKTQRVSVPKGFRSLFNQDSISLTDQTFKQLIDAKLNLLKEQDLISALILTSDDTDLSSSEKETLKSKTQAEKKNLKETMRKKIASNSILTKNQQFRKKILASMTDDRASKLETIRKLQEHSELEFKILENQLLGIVRLNTQTQKDLTLSDLEKEIQ